VVESQRKDATGLCFHSGCRTTILESRVKRVRRNITSTGVNLSNNFFQVQSTVQNVPPFRGTNERQERSYGDESCNFYK
jgi:hypothetical protein